MPNIIEIIYWIFLTIESIVYYSSILFFTCNPKPVRYFLNCCLNLISPKKRFIYHFDANMAVARSATVVW